MDEVEIKTEQPFNLTSSLESGQAHRWSSYEGWHIGVVRGNFLKIRQTCSGIEFRSQPTPEKALVPMVRDYFRLDDDLPAIYDEIKQDQRVADMVDQYPGLRVLRTEPWECLIAFICSANNNISRIHQLMERMAEAFGDPIVMEGQVRYSFPGPAELAEGGEMELRRLGLGFRAPYVDQAAQRVLSGDLNLDRLTGASYLEAKESLMECKGIGPKIADCIAVFSLEKLEAFPIDVWVRRALGEWYFPGQKIPPDRVLLEWAQAHFGRYGGYAQQYLFHGRRLEKKAAAVRL